MPGTWGGYERIDVQPPPAEEPQNVHAVGDRPHGPVSHAHPRPATPGPAMAPPVHRDDAGRLEIFLLLFLVAAAYLLWERHRWKGIVAMLRKRAAGVICTGLAILAFALFADRNIFRDTIALDEMLRGGWIAMFGAAVALVGTYHWIAAGRNISD